MRGTRSRAFRAERAHDARGAHSRALRRGARGVDACARANVRLE
jgi:hypothetical protein